MTFTQHGLEEDIALFNIYMYESIPHRHATLDLLKAALLMPKHLDFVYIDRGGT